MQISLLSDSTGTVMHPSEKNDKNFAIQMII